MEKKRALPKLTVGQVAKEIGCSINTINNYIRYGFISEPVRDKNGYRRFTKSQVNQLREIFELRMPA